MRRDQINYVLVGAMVTAAGLLLLVALYLISGRSVASSRYFTSYASVTGLRQGAPVLYQGFRVGAVDALTPIHDAEGTRYRVTLAIRRDWPIPADSVARLQSSGILADVSIDIREGHSRSLLKPGGELEGVDGGNVFAVMNDLAGGIGELTRNQLVPLVESLSRHVDRIGSLLDANAPPILGDTRELLTRLKRAAQGLDEVLGENNRATLTATLDDTRALVGELRGTRAALDRALAEAGGIAEDNRDDIRRSVQDLAAVLDEMSRKSESILRNLESSSRNLNEFSREVRQNPTRLIRAPQADPAEGESR